MGQKARQKYVTIDREKDGCFKAYFTTRDQRKIGIHAAGRTAAEALGNLILVTPEVVGLEIFRPLQACAECDALFRPEHLDDAGFCGACGQTGY